MKAQTKGYQIVPPATASKTGHFRVVAPGPRLIGRAENVEMAEAMCRVHAQYNWHALRDPLIIAVGGAIVVLLAMALGLRP